MDRRNFLKASSAAALSAGTLSAASAARAGDIEAGLKAPKSGKATRDLRLVTPWADDVSGPGDVVRRIALRIEAATDGGWRIRVETAPEGGLEAVMTGAGDLYFGAEHAHVGFHPAFAYFSGLPSQTGLNADDHFAWINAAGGQELWDDLASQFNIKALVIGHSGRSAGLFTRVALRTPADLKGKRIAANGLAADVLQAAGAIAVRNATDAYAGLIDGHDIDGAELFGPAAALMIGPNAQLLRNAAPARLQPGISDAGFALTLGMRRSFWDGLAESERIVISALATEAFAASRAQFHSTEKMIDLFAASTTATSVAPYQQSASNISDRLARIAATLVAELAGHDELTARIDASYMGFRGRQGWTSS